jgi:chromosome segregation protein
VYLKNLTLRGFKSFASKTELQLEPGITCIVGPNGSGKSNVVDALAWVMGEQGAKTLRGSKMDDVIFAGSDGKSSALGRAEVSLTIDNSDGALPIEYSEVTIKRTMFRGGGSEYQLNGNTCRLLDIQELLSDTGLGKEMHVIVGQGRLDTILNATPADRRGFVEEAAGVLKHRQRKEKALRKLDNMQGNLMRLNDLLAEVRRQLGPLGRQADVAKRAGTIQVNLRDSLSRILADDYTQLIVNKNADTDRIKTTRENYEKVRNAVELMTAEVQKLEQSLTNREVQNVSEMVFKMESLKGRFDALINLANQRQQHLSESTLLFEGQDPNKLRKQAKEANDEYQKSQKSLEILSKNLDKAKDVLDKATHEANVQAQKIKLAQESSQNKQTQIARTETQIESLVARVKDISIQLDDSKLNLKDITSKKNNLSNVAEKLQKSFDDSQIDAEKRVEATKEARNNRQKAQNDVDKAVDDINTLHKEIASYDGTVLALNQMLESQLGDDVVLKSKAVKAADVKGEVTKLKSSLAKISKEAGNNFVVASNNSVANLVAESNAKFSVLNLDGELLYHERNDGKPLTDDNEVTLSIREQLDRVNSDLKAKQSDLVKAENTLNKTQKVLQDATDKVNKAQKEEKDQNQEFLDLKSKVTVANNELHSIENEISRINNRIFSLQENEKDAKSEKKVLDELLKSLSTQTSDASQDLETATSWAAKADADLEKARDAYQDLSTDFASLKTKTDSQLNRHEELTKQAQAEEVARQELEVQEKKRALLAAKSGVVAKVCASAVQRLEASIETVKTEKSRLIQEQTASNQQLFKMRTDLKESRKELDSLSEQIHRFELDQANVDAKIDALKDRIQNEVALDVDVLVKEFGPDVEIAMPNPDDPERPLLVKYNRAEQQARYQKAGRDLKALGKVNPLALEEFEALEERHKYLSDQLVDLDKSKADLLEMIGQIDQKTISAFKSAFEDTAAEFEKVFAILFPGGKGRLKLTDPNDYLTTGIEVEATPAGKRISKLTLLSGGERSLVAVAILVAIFKARPSPFYVMDEVEAALDDVNLSRLLKIFKELKADSQLLIVTHQKRTMEVADALYGITMRKDGITQVISQKI